jgi:hypothetical protein
VNEIESQKLFVIKTDAANRGNANKFPIMHTHAFIIGLPLPNLSAMTPPAMDETKPQKTLMNE